MWLYNHNRITGTVWALEDKKEYKVDLATKVVDSEQGKPGKKLRDAILAEVAVFEEACKTDTKYINPADRIAGVQ